MWISRFYKLFKFFNRGKRVMTNHIPYKWQVKLQIKPTLNKSEVIDGFNFEVSNGETFVTIIYETSPSDELLPERKNDDEYAEQTLSLKYIATIRKLMLARMIYQRIATPLNVEIISKPELLNREELINAGLLRGRPVGKSLVYSWPILDVGDTLSESNDFWKNGFKSKSAGYEDDVLRIADWLQRAESEQDSIKSFILSWIAFNGLYGLYASIYGNGNQPDDQKFEKLVDNLLSNEAKSIIDTYSAQLDTFEKYNVLSTNGGKNWSSELKTERSNSNKEKEILKLAIRCIYGGIRKPIFHEAPDPTDIEKRAEQGKAILNRVTVTALKNFIHSS